MATDGNTRKDQSTNCRVGDELPPEAQKSHVRRGYDIVSADRNIRLHDKLWYGSQSIR